MVIQKLLAQNPLYARAGYAIQAMIVKWNLHIQRQYLNVGLGPHNRGGLVTCGLSKDHSWKQDAGLDGLAGLLIRSQCEAAIFPGVYVKQCMI